MSLYRVGLRVVQPELDLCPTSHEPQGIAEGRLVDRAPARGVGDPEERRAPGKRLLTVLVLDREGRKARISDILGDTPKPTSTTLDDWPERRASGSSLSCGDL
jgi:hypothetical protein